MPILKRLRDKKKKTTRKILGRERQVTRRKLKDGSVVKHVTVRKKAKDGEVQYTSKIKRKGGSDKSKFSKIKGKGAYDVKTGRDISYKGTQKKGGRRAKKVIKDEIVRYNK